MPVPVMVSRCTIANIPDGTNNTIFLEERVAGYKDSAATPSWCNSWAYPVQTGGTSDPDAGAIASPFGSILHPADGSDEYMGPVRMLFDNKAETVYTSPPVVYLPLFSFQPREADARRPGSYHPGLIQVAMGDGSVRTVSATITIATWSAAICPNDWIGSGSPQW